MRATGQNVELFHQDFLSQPSSDHHHQTLIIEEFEPDVFRQLIEYIHTGCVTLQPRTLLGKQTSNLYLVCKGRGTYLVSAPHEC